MTLLRWTPLDEMESLKREMDTLFAPVMSLNGETKPAGFNPPVEVSESDSRYRVRLLLPGLSGERIEEHVRLEATQKTLTVSGELQQPPRDSGEKALLSQFRYGPFLKQMSFTDGIDPEKIEARYTDGILEVELPKMATAQKRSIQIQVQK